MPNAEVLPASSTPVLRKRYCISLTRYCIYLRLSPTAQSAPNSEAQPISVTKCKSTSRFVKSQHFGEMRLRAVTAFLQIASLLLIITVLFSGTLSAQTLDSLKAELRRGNPELRALHLDYQSALTLGQQVDQLPDLEIGAGAFVLPVETRTGPQQFRLGATQMLPWPGKLAAMASLADARAKPLLESFAARQLDLIYQLEIAYFQLAGVQARREVRKESLDIYQSLEEIALSRVESSKGSSVDVYRLQLRRQGLQQELEDLRFAAQSQMTTINQLLNRPADNQVVVELDTDSLIAMILDNAPDLAADDPDLSAHPSLMAIALRQEASRQALIVNDLDAKPGFGVGIDYIATGRREDMNPPGNGRDVIMPRASVRIPLGKGKFTAKRQEEELRILALNARKESVETGFRASIRNALVLMENEANRLYFLAEQLRTLEAAIAVAQPEYANGARRIDELLEFQQQNILLRTETVMARTKILQQQAMIDRYLITQPR